MRYPSVTISSAFCLPALSATIVCCSIIISVFTFLFSLSLLYSLLFNLCPCLLSHLLICLTYQQLPNDIFLVILYFIFQLIFFLTNRLTPPSHLNCPLYISVLPSHLLTCPRTSESKTFPLFICPFVHCLPLLNGFSQTPDQFSLLVLILTMFST